MRPAPEVVEAPAGSEAAVVEEAVIEAAVVDLAVVEQAMFSEADTADLRDSFPDRPVAPTDVATGIPLDSLSFPTRLFNWAEKKGLTTLEELVRIAPRDLLSERNLGRKTIAETRAVVEATLGCAWEDAATDAVEAARAAAGEEAPAPADPFASDDWNVLRLALPEVLAATKLAEIDLPARVVTHMRTEGIATIGELATRSRSQLLAARNLGRSSIPQLVEALRLHMERLESAGMKAAVGLLESWKALLQEQDAVRRMVLTRRAGLGGPHETLQSVGEMLGVSRERERQLETAVVTDLKRERFWLDEVRRRLDAAVSDDGAIAVDDLAADPWWATAAARPEALDYFGEQLLDDAMRVITVEERQYLARCTPATFDEAWDELRKRSAEVPLPALLATFRELTAALVPRVGRLLGDLLFERLGERLHVENAEGVEARVVGFGATQAVAIVATLRASPTPMRVEEVMARAGKNMPDEVLYFDRGLIGLEQHFPDFRSWMARVTIPILEVLQREPPERQWLAHEILEELRELLDLPEWLDHWHLASLLRKGGKLRYLGRNRFALPEAPDQQGRIHYHTEPVRILREHGSPMSRDELFAELRKKTTALSGTVMMNLMRPPFLSCEAERIGLLDRDLPGGAVALVEAVEHVADLLERRGRGLGAAQIRIDMARLSQHHARWPVEMCMSVLRGDPRFRLSQSGAVGLCQWESVRVPTRLEIVRHCLDESEGRVSVEAAQRRIEAYYGAAPERLTVAAFANRFGAALQGERLERAIAEEGAAIVAG